ncbi:FecR domain-containing protein [Pseudomonas sp. CFBP 13719]|uniref:FecR domain-containing protein n=1 Tax=Pseudomonas sp. CFBP 13719 TaxID=2775303 RepID=UPI00177EDF68|nr:FecR family protein [Pseudomonas sp. CFBP 13719]
MNEARSFSPQVAEQAVQWLLELQQGPLDPRQQQAWQRWLHADGEHRRAWDHIQKVNQQFAGLPASLAQATVGAPHSPGRRRALKALLLLGMAGATTLALRQQHWLPPLVADYRSPLGQRRQLQLDDGSRIHLNTTSAVDVRFDAGQRLIHLLEGEIMLTAVADARPLLISTDQGLITAGRGQVNVRQLPGSTQVQALQGAVTLEAAGLHGEPQRLADGQQLEFERQRFDPPRPLDANSGAWVDGMLIAAHMRLGDFLAEVGRYRRGQLDCDARAANLLLSGSFPLGDTERILDSLEAALPVNVRRFTRYWVTVQSRA